MVLQTDVIPNNERLEPPHRVAIQVTEEVTKAWYSGWLPTYSLQKDRSLRHLTRSCGHIPMPHELASYPSLRSEELAELLCVSEIVGDS
jgi:hypothetical protein